MVERKESIEALLKLVQDFIDGHNRSVNHVKKIEGDFAELFNHDKRFEDLQYALSMYGSGTTEEDEKWLLAELKNATNLLKA